MPLCVHGDAVPCLSTRKAGTQSFDVFSMEGLLSTGSTKTVKLFVHEMFEHNKSRRTTQVCVQCGRLFRGHRGRFMMGFGLLGPTQEAEFRLGTPERTRTGAPLANRWFGTLRSMESDLDHFANAFHLNLYGSANMNEIWAAFVGCVFAPLHALPVHQPGHQQLHRDCPSKRSIPKLRGKGAEVKDLAVPLQEVFASEMRPRHADDAVIAKMLRDQCELQRILSEKQKRHWNHFLPSDDATKVTSLVNRIL